MRSIAEKLKSRKLWAAIVGVITGIAVIFGLDEGIITTFSGAAVAVASVVSYIVTEGKIDAAAIGEAAQKVEDAVEELNKND